MSDKTIMIPRGRGVPVCRKPTDIKGQEPGRIPIVGFLVSYASSDCGEFWVLREGRQTIGSDFHCAICLEDPYVSGTHAQLIVRRQDDGKLIMALLDQASTNGTYVNGEEIGFSAHLLSDRDAIEVGSHVLLLLAVDQMALGREGKESSFDWDGLMTKILADEQGKNKKDGGIKKLTSPYD